MAPRSAASVLALAIVALAWVLGRGPAGLGYLGLYALLLLPGLPIGFLLFGRRHAAGWIAGAVIGYALSAIALWVPADLGLTTRAWIPVAWTVLAASTFWLCPVDRVLVALPVWRRGDSAALVLSLLVVPVLLAVPFSRIGNPDPDGARRYRAYFTADFLWHVALSAELAKVAPPIRNPYLERRALNYYWAYFVPPAMIARLAHAEHALEACLLLNALGAGLLFVACMYLYAWCVVPRAGPAALAVLLTILAASAEGLFAIFRLARSNLPLNGLRELNIDAMTSWILQSLTIDSLPRSLWYTPQHAAACGLGLVALIVPVSATTRLSWTGGLVAGLPLGLAIIFSPFLGGVFCLLYGLTAIRAGFARGDRPVPAIAAHATALVPALAGLGWCLLHKTFEGAAGVVVFGLSSRAAAAPVATIALAAGPVLALGLAGLLVARRTFAWPAAIVGPALALLLFYFVTLSSEPIWIGWRAGQILLVTLPPLAAALFAWLRDSGRAVLVPILATLVLILGLPTTAIDAWNAQDVENQAMGPGFRWTVVVPKDTQAAMTWIRQQTRVDAVVQMSIGPRGRETWTLVPTFGQRRMAAGQPISLLHVPEYDERSKEIDAIYRSPNAADAARLAHGQRITYVFVDGVERQAFGAEAIDKFRDPQFFTPVFHQGEAAVFEVR
ncbi:MAG: hypothetical protein ABIX28_15955 [Vicinamibacterales bacterium]